MKSTHESTSCDHISNTCSLLSSVTSDAARVTPAFRFRSHVQTIRPLFPSTLRCYPPGVHAASQYRQLQLPSIPLLLSSHPIFYALRLVSLSYTQEFGLMRPMSLTNLQGLGQVLIVTAVDQQDTLTRHKIRMASQFSQGYWFC